MKKMKEIIKNNHTWAAGPCCSSPFPVVPCLSFFVVVTVEHLETKKNTGIYKYYMSRSSKTPNTCPKGAHLIEKQTCRVVNRIWGFYSVFIRFLLCPNCWGILVYSQGVLRGLRLFEISAIILTRAVARRKFQKLGKGRSLYVARLLEPFAQTAWVSYYLIGRPNIRQNFPKLLVKPLASCGNWLAQATHKLWASCSALAQGSRWFQINPR